MNSNTPQTKPGFQKSPPPSNLPTQGKENNILSDLKQKSNPPSSLESPVATIKPSMVPGFSSTQKPSFEKPVSNQEKNEQKKETPTITEKKPENAETEKEEQVNPDEFFATKTEQPEKKEKESKEEEKNPAEEESQNITIKTRDESSSVPDKKFDSTFSDIITPKEQTGQTQTPAPQSGPGMKKTIILGLVAVLLLVTGVSGYYFFFIKNQTPEQSSFGQEEQDSALTRGYEEQDSSSISDTSNIPIESAPVTPITEEQLKLNGVTGIAVNAATPVELVQAVKNQFPNLSTPTQLILSTNNQEINFSQLKIALGLEIPSQIIGDEQNFALVVLNENSIPKVALVIESSNSPEITKAQMQEWEQTIVQDLTPLFFETPVDDFPSPDQQIFQDSSKFPNSRYSTLSPSKELSLDYSILTDKIIIATNYRIIEAVIPFLQ